MPAVEGVVGIARWDGTAELQAKFAILPDRYQRYVMRHALERVGRRIVATAKGLAPKRFGLLRASMATKTTKGKKGRVSLLVGPSRGRVKRMWQMKRWSKYQGLWPTRYAHLVERGHGGPRAAPPHPFLGPALRQHIGELNDAFVRETEREFAKLHGP